MSATKTPAAYLLPSNLVTYLAIAAGVAAAALTRGPEDRHFAGACLAVAALADLFDGRFARLFPLSEDQKSFGVQIDSLADVLSFGLVPAVCLERVAAAEGGARLLLLACCFVYVVCAVTRLAFYNVTQSDGSGFIGVPTTLLGIFWSGWLLAKPPSALVTAIALLVGGASMVSSLRIPRPGLKTFVVIVLTCITLTAVHVWAW